MLTDRLIKPENIKDYGYLIPDHFHERLSAGEIYAIAVTHDRYFDESLVGVVITDVVGDWVHILWYALAPGYVNEEYARAMLDLVITDARAGGMAAGVVATLSSSDAYGDQENIFGWLGFTVFESPENVLEFSLDSVKADAVSVSADEGEFVPLKDTDDRTLNILGNLMATDERNVPVETPVRWSRFDQALSFVRMKDDKPAGVMLVHRDEDTAVVDLAYEKDASDFIKMVSHLASGGRQALDGSTRVIVPVLDERLFEVIGRFVPDAKRRSVMTAYRSFPGMEKTDLYAEQDEA